MNNKCPFCGEEMTPGVIQSRDGVYWSRKAGPMAALQAKSPFYSVSMLRSSLEITFSQSHWST